METMTTKNQDLKAEFIKVLPECTVALKNESTDEEIITMARANTRNSIDHKQLYELLDIKDRYEFEEMRINRSGPGVTIRFYNEL